MTLELTIQLFFVVTAIALVLSTFISNRQVPANSLDIEQLLRREAEARYRKKYPVTHSVIKTIFLKKVNKK